MFTFPQPLTAGAHRLRIVFTARINKFGTGLFFVDYPTGEGTKRMLSSKLEPADVRRIFPCWDEPAFKATFALTVTVPQAFLAVDNMPVTRETPVAPNLKQVAFAPTPKMSTYLFVFTAGELERLTADADGVTIGVVTTAGKREQGRFALDNAVKLFAYFNDYFGVTYLSDPEMVWPDGITASPDGYMYVFARKSPQQPCSMAARPRTRRRI